MERWFCVAMACWAVLPSAWAGAYDDRPDSVAYPTAEGTVWETCDGPNYIIRAFLNGERVHWSKIRAVVTNPQNWRCVSPDLRANYIEIVRMNPELRLPLPPSTSKKHAASHTPELIPLRPPTPQAPTPPVSASKGQLPGVEPLRCPNGARKALHLTFDDGPQAGTTEKVLAALDAYGVRASFFMLGEKLAEPSQRAQRQMLLDRMRSKHTLCSHTYHHIHSLDPSVSADEACRNIRQPYSLPEAALLSRCVRMPYGQGYFSQDQADERSSEIKSCIKSLGLRHFLWNVDSEDWKGGDLPSLLARLKKEICGASETKLIVLFHDTQSLTVNNLPAILESLKRGGHRFIGMAELAPSVLRPAPRLGFENDVKQGTSLRERNPREH